MTELEKYPNIKLHHICEICGKEERLTPEEGYEKGWDYPPRMFPFAMVAPRTCGNCGMVGTVWYEMVYNHKSFADLTDKQKETVLRILGEPGSIIKDKV